MKTLGLLVSRTGTKDQNEFFAQVMLEQYCEDILDYKERDEIGSYDPDWVIVLCDDEVLSPRMGYMFNSLIMNKYVNTWTSKAYYFWDSEDVYRIDKLWNTFSFPMMYRYIPEIDYQWGKGSLIPVNQPGPIEDSSVPLLSYYNLTDRQRLMNHIEYGQTRNENNQITQMHYDSLMDDDIKLERWIE